MSYTLNAPTYEAIQWDGVNTEEILATADAWFSCWPDQHATHDPESGLITTCTGHQLGIGDWLVSAGSWGLPEAGRDGSPEVAQDAAFQVKYAQQA
jgi:hypothetical protein